MQQPGRAGLPLQRRRSSFECCNRVKKSCLDIQLLSVADPFQIHSRCLRTVSGAAPGHWGMVSGGQTAQRKRSALEGIRSSRLETRASQPGPCPVCSDAGRGPLWPFQLGEGICSLHESEGLDIVIHLHRVHSLAVGAQFFRRRHSDRDLLGVPAPATNRALHRPNVLLRRVGNPVHDTRQMEPVSAARSLKDRLGGL